MLIKNRKITFLLSLTLIIILGARASFAQVKTPVESTTSPQIKENVSNLNSKVEPSVSPTSLPKTATPTPKSISSFSHFFNFEKTAGNWLGLAGVLIAISFGFFQWFFSQKKQEELQKELKKKELENSTKIEELKHQYGQELKQKDLENSAKIEELKYHLLLKAKKWELRQDRFKERLEERKRIEQDAKAEAQRLEAIENQVKNYCQGLSKELENLKILDMPRPLNLKDVYVQLKVREHSLNYVKKEELTEFSTVRLEELFQQNQARLREQSATAISPEDALVSFQRIVLLGDPGAGKTTTLKYLALEMLQGSDKLPYLPIYVELKKYIESKMDTLLDFIAFDWIKTYNFNDARSYLEEQLKNGRAALLLDGLDEVQGGSTVEDAENAYNKVATEISNLSKRPCPIVVTCRQRGWKGGLAPFRDLEVLDFSWEQIQKFLESWFRLDLYKADDLRIKLESNSHMRILGANPLILSLIAIVYEQDLGLPEGRSELYRRCVEVFLGKWDLDKNVRRFSKFTTDNKHDLLKEIAWHFHRKRQRYFSRKELLAIISNFLSTLTISSRESTTILDEITTQFGLLKEQAHGWYGFLHLTFQEYFTALAVTERAPHSLSDVIAHKHSTWWEEVILLTAAQMPDATPLLLGILHGQLNYPTLAQSSYSTLQMEDVLSIDDDLFNSNLLLAARCLISNETVQVIGLRDSIISQVKVLLLNSPYEFDWERAAKILIEVGGSATQDLLGILADNSIQPFKRRAVIAEVIGKSNNNHAVPTLLSIFGQLEPDQRNLNLRTSILEALISLKEYSIISDLRNILEKEGTSLFKVRLIKAMGILSDKAEASLSLLQMLLDEDTPTDFKVEISQSIRELKEPSVINQILNYLRDESLNWQLRWLLAECLEGLREHVEVELEEILEDLAISEPVRVSIATVFGNWGVQKVLPFLYKAIEQSVVPPNLSIDYQVWSGYIWATIARVSKKLGDTSIQRLILQAFGTESLREFELGGIALAVAEFNPEAAARKIVTLLKQHNFIFSPILLSFLPTLATKSIETELLSLLDSPQALEVDPRFKHSLDIAFIATAIGRVSNTVEAVDALLKPLRALSNSSEPIDVVESIVMNALYNALYQVSQQAKVRLTRDYQIQSL